MATPGIPPTFNVQTANQVNYISWGITPGAVTYVIQRSTDGVTYTTYVTQAAVGYLDTAVTLGSTYWYKVAARNADSPVLDADLLYTSAQSAVPVPSGEACLGQIRLQAQQRADRVNSNFVTLTEWNSYINQSLFELYDLLITAYGEEYFAAPALTFNTDGTTQFYDLPNGTNYSAAPAFYKLMGIDLGLNISATPNNGWVTLEKFNFIDRNAFYYPNTNSSQYGVFNMRYRLFGNKVEFIPTPSSGQPMRLWYIPRMTMLLRDTDTTTSGVSGWLEYVITDAAIKALIKEESDVSVLMVQKMALIKRIEAVAMNRDTGQPDTISDTRGATGWRSGGGNSGGWGAGW